MPDHRCWDCGCELDDEDNELCDECQEEADEQEQAERRVHNKEAADLNRQEVARELRDEEADDGL